MCLYEIKQNVFVSYFKLVGILKEVFLFITIHMHLQLQTCAVKCNYAIIYSKVIHREEIQLKTLNHLSGNSLDVMPLMLKIELHFFCSVGKHKSQHNVAFQTYFNGHPVNQMFNLYVLNFIKFWRNESDLEQVQRKCVCNQKKRTVFAYMIIYTCYCSALKC